jgi:phosphoglycerate dehydrogenase-like enzyme
VLGTCGCFRAPARPAESSLEITQKEIAMSKKPLIYIHRVEWCPAEYYMTQANRDLLASFADVRDEGDCGEAQSHEQMVENLRGADGILLLNSAHADELTYEAVKEAGTVKVTAVSHWWTGQDKSAADMEKAGVKVIDASDPCNQAVAEWALGSIIMGLRKADVFDRLIKTGTDWPEWRGVAGQLNGATVGLVAIGRVGRWLLKYLKPFDTRVLVYDPFVSDEEVAELGAEKADLDTLLKICDAISLHAPVMPETKAMIGKRELGLIRDGALLVNCARAWLLDNDAFRAEMKSGRFRAYLDVFEPEPLPGDDVLRTLDNVVMTPHVAGTTDLMFERCGRFAIEALRDYLAGERK